MARSNGRNRRPVWKRHLQNPKVREADAPNLGCKGDYFILCKII